MLYTAIFPLRRLLIVSFFYIDIVSVRYAAILYPIQIPYLYYLITYRPLKAGLNIEIINELGVNLFFMVIPIYSNAVPSAKDRYILGWIMIAAFFLLFIINLSSIIAPSVKKLKVKLMRKCKTKEKAKP